MIYHAFVRRKRCGSCLTVRAGREAKHEGCDWERKVEGQYSGNVVTLEAFERTKDQPRLPPGMFEATLHALFDDTFELVEFERVRNKKHYPLYFTRKEGRIIMSHKPLHEEMAEKHGGLKASRPSAGLAIGESRSIPLPDAATFKAITDAYNAKIGDGSFKVGPQLTETYLGGGAYLRTFYIDETPHK